jgi:hypothetical protein
LAALGPLVAALGVLDDDNRRAVRELFEIGAAGL